MNIYNPLRYVSTIFAAYSLIYFSMQRTESAYKLVTVGGSLSLLIALLSMSFESVRSLFSGNHAFFIFFFFSYGFFFSAYALYHFSMKFQRGRDEKKLVQEGVTVLASLITFLFFLRNGLIMTIYALTMLVARFFLASKYLIRAFKN